MNTTRVIALIVCVLVSVATRFDVLLAAPGDVDLTFGSSGRVVTRVGSSPSYPFASAVALQPDGKIVVAGIATINDPGFPDDPSDDQLVEGGVVVRYNADGSLDGTFGQGDGVVLTAADFNQDGVSPFGTWIPEAVVVQPDGKIIVAGGGGFALRFPNLGGIIVARYDAAGRLDPTFGRFSLLQFDDPVDPVYPGYDDSLGVIRPGMIVLGNICDSVSGLAVLPDGRLLVAAGCEANIVRINPNGSPDRTFAGGSSRFDPLDEFTVEAGGLAVQSDGRIVIAGSTAIGDFTVARVTPNAQRDVTFGGDGRVFTQVGFPGGDLLYSPRPVMIQPDGKIVVAGTVAADAMFTRGVGLVRYHPDGTLDPGFGISGSVVTPFGAWTEVLAAGLQAEGKIVTAGMRIDATGCERFVVMRHNADGSLDDGFGVNGTVQTDFADLTGGAGCNGMALALAIQLDQKIVAAGSVSVGGTLTPTTATFIAVARYTSAGAPAGNTAPGANVSVDLGSVALTFANVLQGGDTTVTTSTAGPTPPSGFQLGNPATYWDINTTATFSGSVQVCINYSGITFGNEANLRLFHLEGQVLVDRTDAGFPDVAANVICGTVSSLSPFAVLEQMPSAAELIVQLIQSLRRTPLSTAVAVRLTALLEGALENPRHVATTCRLLDLFIGHLQRESGNHIPPDVASQLIHDAQAIQAALGC